MSVKTTICAAVIMAAMSGGLASIANAADEGTTTTPAATRPAGEHKAKYVCPMGCETSDKPGKCSKCGMDLKKAKADKENKGQAKKGDKADKHEKHEKREKHDKNDGHDHSEH